MSNEPKNEAILEAREVRKWFRSGAQQLDVLSGVSLAVRTGEIVSIVGASGSGKSTLLHILGALDMPSDGDIALDGTQYGRLGETARAAFRNQTIGFVFQFHHLLPEFTAQENVAMPALIRGLDPAAAMALAAELLAAVGLADRARHRATELSGGEQQRVAVARALVNRPKLVLADEPTGNLDDKTGRQLVDLLWGLHQTRRMSMVIVTHDQELAARAHRRLRLAGGVLHEIG
jgi:lipoprotein-releasing system ATP-binding protein